MIELKPCPFCGGKAYIGCDEIACYDCMAQIPFAPLFYEQPWELSDSEKWENARKETIEAWNRREGEKSNDQ